MGIDVHAFNFLRMQASASPLGSVLTIGRQSLGISQEYIHKNFDAGFISNDSYCEPLLMALGALDVASLDFSDYEGATFIGDLNKDLNIGRQFDCVIDSGSLEHVFDIATAFRNLKNACCVGGRIIHILPVNNLNGHGFWQFSSDLMYSLYRECNGFTDTKVYYASSIDDRFWYEMPRSNPGQRLEVVSVEPLILLSITVKKFEVDSLTVVQPFYERAWSEKNVSALDFNSENQGLLSQLTAKIKRVLKSILFLRNMLMVSALAIGSTHFSVMNSRYKKLRVSDLVKGLK
jgi:hypothetical protein